MRLRVTPSGMDLVALEEESPEIADSRKAQKLSGELEWLTTRTRPDIAYAQHRISSLAGKVPKKALVEVLKRYTCKPISRIPKVRGWRQEN